MAKVGSIKKCELCGKEFEVHFAAEKYCSRKCYQEAMQIAKADEDYKAKEAKAKGKSKEKVCIVCGKPFYTKRNRVLCCSGACTREHRKTQKNEYYNQMYESIAKVSECIVCGAVFQKKKANQVCCSPECSEQHYKEIKKIYGKTYTKPGTPKRQRKKKPKPFAKIQEEMKKAGFDPRDYGKYMAMQYMNEHK